MLTDFKTILRTFGPLRFALITLVFLDMLFRPVPGVPVDYEGLRIISHLLAPVLSPILFMLILLDVMMSMIYRSDKQGSVRTHYLIIVLFELLLALLFFLYWLPYFQALNV
jgi:hypothetical protein